MTAGSQDITARLRKWTHAIDAAPASDLMDEAAGEIEMLRMALLTDAEREAIAAGLGALGAMYADSPPISRPIYEQHAPTLRGLLERTK